MDRLEIQVLEFIKHNIPIDPGDVVLIGVSGFCRFVPGVICH